VKLYKCVKTGSLLCIISLCKQELASVHGMADCVVDGGGPGVVQELSSDSVWALAAGDRRDDLWRCQPRDRQTRAETTTETVRRVRGKL